MNLEDLAEAILNLSPDESEKLSLIIKAKIMPEMERQKGLLDEQSDNPQMQNMARPQEPAMAPPTTRDVALRSLLG